MNRINIGVADMHYNEDGTMNTVLTHFTPNMEVPIDDSLKNRLEKVKCANDVGTVKSNADMVLGSWFNQMTRIELEDRMDCSIQSEVVGECEKYPSGSIKHCQLQYYFARNSVALN